MSRLYVNPEVTILCGTNNNGYKAWLESRKCVVSRDNATLKVGNEVFDDESVYEDRIRRMGLQYNNLDSLVIHFKGSVLFRDILFNINKIGQWAVSSRFQFSTYDDFREENYPISSEYKDIPTWEDQFTKYMKLIEKTKITDENRAEMPYSISTEYWININFNTLISMLSMLKLKFPFFFNIYGELIISAYKSTFGLDLHDYLKPNLSADMSQYFRKFEWKESYNRVEDTIHLNIKMGLLLYSQFIRQMDSCIKGFYDELVHDDPEEFKYKVFYSGSELKVSYTADIDKFMKTISNRICWFSMSSGNGINSWSRVLDLVLKDLSLEEFKELIPCKFNCLPELDHCPYYDDVKFRGKDGAEKRNLPCAILMNDLDIAIQRDNYDNTILSDKYLQLVKHLNWE